jgi:hypothetical protein
MFSKTPAIFKEDNFKDAIHHYVKTGILINGYASIHQLKKDLDYLNKQDLAQFSHSVVLNDLPQNILFAIEHTCNKATHDLFFSGAGGSVAAGASYFLLQPTSFFLAACIGSSGFAVLALSLFSYRMYQKSSEASDMRDRFNEIFKNLNEKQRFTHFSSR